MRIGSSQPALLLVVFTIILLTSSSFIAVPQVQAAALNGNGRDPIDSVVAGKDRAAKINATYARGDTWSTSYSSKNGKYTTTLGLMPYVSDGSSYKPFIQSSTPSFIQVQTGLVGARIFSSYASILKPDMTKVEVAQEKWTLQFLDGGVWHDAVLSNLSTSVLNSDKWVEVIKTWNTQYLGVTGVLTVNYHFEQSLKHTVTWTPVNGWLLPRVIQSWTGIASPNVQALSSTRNGKNSTFIFTYNNGSISITEDQLSAITLLNSTEINLGGGARQASFTFLNQSLTSGSSLVIDPTTATIVPDSAWYTSESDVSGGVCPTGTAKGTGTATTRWVYEVPDNIVDTTCARSAVEWNTAAVPDTALIADTTVDFDSAAVSNPIVTDWNQISSEIIAASASTIWTDAGNGHNYLSSSTILNTAGNNKHVDLGASADSDLQALLSSNWFAVGIKAHSETLDGSTHLSYVDDSAATGTPRWTLTVVYSLNVNIRIYAANGSTTADNVTPVYVTYTNTTSTYHVSMSGLWLNLTGQSSTVTITVQAFNTTVSNSFVTVNGSNSLSFTSAGNYRALTSIYLTVTCSFKKDDGTSFSPSTFDYTFGNNGTTKSGAASCGGTYVNGTNTISRIRWQGDNVKNSSTGFAVTSNSESLVFKEQIYTVTFTARDTMLLAITTGVQFNITIGNTGNTTKLAMTSSGGSYSTYLQNGSITISAWWRGIWVGNATAYSYSVASSTTVNLNVQVGNDGVSKIRFAEGTSVKGTKSAMIEGIFIDYQVQPAEIIVNSTVYTSISAGWNYTSSMHLMNLTEAGMKSRTTLSAISLDNTHRVLTFNTTGSGMSMYTVSYSAMVCAGGSLTLNLKEDVSGAVFPTPSVFGVNVTAYYPTYSQLVGQNVTTVTVCSGARVFATVNTPAGGQYFRNLLPTAAVQNLYLIDTTKESAAGYQISIKDFTNKFGNGTIRIYSIGWTTAYEISSGYISAGFTFPVYLIPGNRYNVLIVSQSGDRYYTEGVWADPTTADLQITLTSSNVVSQSLIGSNVFYNITYISSSQIRFTYLSLNGSTTSSLRVRIWVKNSTSVKTLIYDNTWAGVVANTTVTTAGDGTLSTIALFEYTNSVTGSQAQSLIVTGQGTGYNMRISISSTVMGLNGLIPSQFNWSYLFGFIMIIVTALLFSQANAEIGGIVIALEAALFWSIGYLPARWETIALAGMMAVLGYILKKENQP